MSADELVHYAAFMTPPRSIFGTGILFEAAVMCTPHEPRHPYFELALMKIDYRSPERMEFEVGRVEFDDPQYSSGGGYYLSGCYVRRAGRETGSDRYYVVLRMYQIYDEGVASAIADTKPPVLISW